MDAAAVASPAMGVWASIRGYFTPATLFLVVNLVIGTIALTSRSHQRRRRQGYHYHHQEMLHQLPPQHQEQEYHQYYGQQQETLYVPPPPPAPLARKSSVLERFRSFGLYRFRSGDFPPEYGAAAVPSHTEDVIPPMEEMKQTHYARSRSEPAPAQEEKKAASRLENSSSEVRRAEVVRAPARVVEAFAEETAVDGRADEFVDNFTPKLQQDLHYQEEYVPPPAPLARTSSVLDRLRSFSLYRFRSGDLAPEDIAAAATPSQDAATAAASDEEKQAAHYGRSRSEPAREQNKKVKKKAASEAKMTKSSSEARKDAAGRSIAEEADDGVDARADDFINKFRQQLQLQRLNSLLNYNRGGKQ